MWRWDPDLVPPIHPYPYPWPRPPIDVAATRGLYRTLPWEEPYGERPPRGEINRPPPIDYYTRGGGEPPGVNDAAREDAFLKSSANSISYLLTQFEGDDPDPTKPMNQRIMRDLLCCCCEVGGYLKARGYVPGPTIETRGGTSTRGACGDMVRALERGDRGSAADHFPGCVREVSRAMDGKKP